MKENKNVISILDDLIETTKDGQEGFKQAAESVKDPQLKSLLNEYSSQRSRFATELRTQAQSLGKAEPEERGSAAGALRRGWINLKSAVTRADDHAILVECERGEDSAVEQYKEAMDENLPAQVREIVSRQYTDIKSAHDRIKNLRDPLTKRESVAAIRHSARSL
jgi:uncharacterized protein (TIGR02284 family)